ncbi:MAG: Gfo/Idh/MocA family oxidoreductase [Planctomycetaceae bacterium]|nr:Gfo/Idh/MocA family oxidoreductase [Planctomycetaceae bacterium]
MKEKTYRVGILGFGMIGKVHAYAYAAMPFYSVPMNATFRITHVATSRKETAEQAKSICRADVATTDYREITENPNIDIVHICTPNDLHVEPLLSAIKHRKKIYCDKPLSASLEEAESVHTALQESKYAEINQMTFHNRFFPALIRAKKLLHTEALGRILQFRLGYFHSSNASASIPFRWKHTQFGGAVRDLGSHLLDLTTHLLGPIESLLAETMLAFPQRLDSANALCDVESEDAVSMLVRMQSGASGVIEATKLATGNEDEMLLEIHGELGALRFRLMQPHYLEFFDARATDRPLGGDVGWKRIPCGGRYELPDYDFPSPKASIGWMRAHVACLSNFLHAVAEDRQTTPDLYQGIAVDRLIYTVLRSAAERRWVDVESIIPA